MDVEVDSFESNLLENNNNINNNNFSEGLIALTSSFVKPVSPPPSTMSTSSLPSMAETSKISLLPNPKELHSSINQTPLDLGSNLLLDPNLHLNQHMAIDKNQKDNSLIWISPLNSVHSFLDLLKPYANFNSLPFLSFMSPIYHQNTPTFANPNTNSSKLSLSASNNNLNDNNLMCKDLVYGLDTSTPISSTFNITSTISTTSSTTSSTTITSTSTSTTNLANNNNNNNFDLVSDNFSALSFPSFCTLVSKFFHLPGDHQKPIMTNKTMPNYANELLDEVQNVNLKNLIGSK